LRFLTLAIAVLRSRDFLKLGARLEDLAQFLDLEVTQIRERIILGAVTFPSPVRPDEPVLLFNAAEF
jgi:hypothetical protein